MSDLSKIDLDFSDIDPIQLVVKIGEFKYILREASADAAVKYRNIAIGASRFEEGKIVSISGAADAEPLLVSCCLFLLKPDEKGTTVIMEDGKPVKYSEYPVPVSTVRTWSNRIVGPLYKKVKEISELDRDEKDAKGQDDPAKNGLAGTQTSSELQSTLSNQS